MLEHMKLKIPAIYSQRDPQWASFFLGFNTALPYTIGNYGCLITCLGMYVGKNPSEVNDLVKSVNGFQSGGLFVWNKSTILGITQTYLSPRYDGPVTTQGFTKLHELLDGGFPVLCEIDFNPNTSGEEMHYVLLYGYEGETYFAADPWTGTLIDLSVYGGPARAILQFRTYDKILPKDDGQDLQSQLDSVRAERDRNWNWFTAVCEALGVGANVDAAVAEAKKLVGNDDVLVQKDKQIQEAQTQINDLRAELVTITESHNTLQASYDTLQGQLTTDNGIIDDLTQKLSDLEAHILQPVYKGWKLWLVNFIKNL
jgi:hypothetical protein